MKRLKKAAAIISAAMILNSTAAVTANADASIATVDMLLSMNNLTEYLESNDIPFTELADAVSRNRNYGTENPPAALVRMLDEKNIEIRTLLDFFNDETKAKFDQTISSMIYDGRGDFVETEIAIRLLDIKFLLTDKRVTYYSPSEHCFTPEMEEMLEQCYVWTEENGWEFDYVTFYEMNNYLMERYNYTSNVSNNLAASGNTVICRSKITGNNKTTKVNIYQYLERRSGKRWNVVKVWSQTAGNSLTLSKNLKVQNGTYRLRSVFRAYEGKNCETITRYSGIKVIGNAFSRSAVAYADTCGDYSVYDINHDGAVDISDADALQKALAYRTADESMDINGDGKVNVFDVVAFKRMLTEDKNSGDVQD